MEVVYVYYVVFCVDGPALELGWAYMNSSTKMDRAVLDKMVAQLREERGAKQIVILNWKLVEVQNDV